jgi:hypothetical protein
MANWCSNHLHATGGNVQGLHELFESARRHTLEKHEGWTMYDNHYLFDFDRNDDQWNFETRWSPPIEEILAICRFGGVSVEMDYVETGNCIYGRMRYDHTTGEVIDICLDDSDFARVSYDDETDTYRFNDEVYESEYEPLNEMLEDKWNGIFITSRKRIDHVIALLEDFEGDGVVTDDLLYYMRSNLEKGGVL